MAAMVGRDECEKRDGGLWMREKKGSAKTLTFYAPFGFAYGAWLRKATGSKRMLNGPEGQRSSAEEDCSRLLIAGCRCRLGTRDRKRRR